MTSLDLARFSHLNATRADRWHRGFPHNDDGWSGADWSNAMCGEAGEAANVVKKLRRIEFSLEGNRDQSFEDLKAKLAAELADTFTYLDLLATFYHLDLSQAIIDKFNAVSEENGFPERYDA